MSTNRLNSQLTCIFFCFFYNEINKIDFRKPEIPVFPTRPSFVWTAKSKSPESVDLVAWRKHIQATAPSARVGKLSMPRLKLSLSTRDGKISKSLCCCTKNNPKNSCMKAETREDTTFRKYLVHVYYSEARKERSTHTSTPIPLNSAGARSRHRCAPG